MSRPKPSRLRDLQCPECRSWFRTANHTKKYCGEKCQQRHKQVLRAARASSVRDFKPDFQNQHRRASGAAASRRAAEGPPTVDWPAVIERFKADMAQRYGSEDE